MAHNKKDNKYCIICNSLIEGNYITYSPSYDVLCSNYCLIKYREKYVTR